MEKIGFIGLGIMGKPMCKRLINAGYDVTVYVRRKEVQEELVKMGAKAVDSPREMAKTCSMIITMVRNDKETEEVVEGRDGIICEPLDGVLLVLMSTISPGLCKRLSMVVSKKGGSVIDAPVSGASGGAKGSAEGTLTIMVGGDKHNFERSLPVLKEMGKNIFHLGEIGRGEATKIICNLVGHLTQFVLVEALEVAKATGMDLELTRKVMSLSIANSRVLESLDIWIPRRRASAPEGTRTMGYKDIGLGVGLAHELNVDVPIARRCLEIDLTAAVEQLLS
jgi:3-hydroxyisobutyrate dehydrogenase-like beta-hydroxyacid dehydrogenase